MRLAVVLFLGLLFNFSQSASYLELTKSDFHSKIQGLDYVLVKFYAEWCGHCKKLAPAFDAAAAILLQQENPVTLAKVNCPENEELCGEFGVTGYPTLKIFKKGKLVGDYEGGRTEDAIVQHMIARSKPSVSIIAKEAELEKLRKEGDKPVFLVVVDSESTDLAKAFSQVADAHSMQYIFALSLSKDVFKMNNILRRYLPLRYKSKLEDEFVEYDGPETESAIADWVNENWGGILPIKTQENADHFYARPLAIVFTKVDYEKDPKGTNYIRNRVLKTINKVKASMPKMRFAMASASSMAYEMGNFGVSEPSDKESYVGIYDEKELKYKMEDKFDWENLEKFLLNFNDGKLEPYVKSEPLESLKEESAVQKIIGLNFDELITKSKKDILLEFYAPWCGHCKSLKPKYEELAGKMKGEDNLMIAAIDATANDYPKTFPVQGFPTIFWIPAGGSPQRYEGGREVDDFVKYIAQKATKPLFGFNSDGSPKKTEL